MDRRLKLPIAVAALGVAAMGAWAWMARAPAAPQAPVAPPGVVEHCRRAAELLYDVHWAAACFKADDSNDCMLPDAQAAAVNSILASEEARCMAVESRAMADR